MEQTRMKIKSRWCLLTSPLSWRSWFSVPGYITAPSASREQNYMINGTFCLKKTFFSLQMHGSFVIAFMVTSIWQTLPKCWTYVKAKSTCSSKTGCIFPMWNTSLSSHSSSESSGPWPYSSNYWNFMGNIGQGTSFCPLCCPSLPCTAAAPLPTHSPCPHSLCTMPRRKQLPTFVCPSYSKN